MKCANYLGKHASVSCDVPQGSILGSLLFLIYVNDMSQAIKCDVFLYANGCQHNLLST